MSEETAPLEITEDAFLGGQLRLRQPKSGHRAGHDAILLAAATSVRPGARVVEFGAGVGAAGLALARRVVGTCAEWSRSLSSTRQLPAQEKGASLKQH